MTRLRLPRRPSPARHEKPGRPRRVLVLLAIVAAALLAGGCTEKSEVASTQGTEPLSLALDFYVNPDHAGIYHGVQRGHFTDAGVELDIKVPTDPAAPIRQVAAGQVDLAISYAPEVLLARDQGLPVVAVAALVGQPLTSLISLPEAKISEPANLKGKTIATAGIAYQTAFLEAILDRNKLKPKDVRQVDVGLGLLPAVLSKKADAMLGGFRNIEGVDLELRGEKPRIVPVDELGIPTYDELVLVANSDTLDDKRELVRDFIAALGEATFDAADKPRQATAAVLDAGDGLEPKLTEAEIAATLPLLLPIDKADPFGYMDPGQWRKFANFMYRRGLLEREPDVGTTIDTSLLPDA